MPVFHLTEKISFPPVEFADESGLLAVGGDLSADRLLFAYKMGIFPWYDYDTPILWWSPDPRMVLFVKDFHIPKSLKKIIKKNKFKITMDNVFQSVITECALSRLDFGEETWITEEMVIAYTKLHEAGYAHSVEVWDNGSLAGGLYGISIGRMFFGESMFTRVDNASKVGFVYLVKQLAKWGFDFIDCQVATDNLKRFGAVDISRKEFCSNLAKALDAGETMQYKWNFTNDFKIFG